MPNDSNGADGERPVSGGQHHISSIAHLFFAADETRDLAGLKQTNLQLAVTCFNDSRIAAFASGHLVEGVRRMVAPGSGQAVRLVQESGLTWSARSFIGADAGPAKTGARSESGQWNWPEVADSESVTRQVCWTLLQADRDRSLAAVEYLGAAAEASLLAPAAGTPVPGRDGLVACMLAREVGDLSAGIRLGRLLGQLAPRLLEIVVFPDNWAARGPDGSRSRGWFGLTEGRNRQFLARCRDLTRALGGASPVTITNLPGDDEGHGPAEAAAILRSMALRLVGDF